LTFGGRILDGLALSSRKNVEVDGEILEVDEL
jgi:hypothetical protein